MTAFLEKTIMLSDTTKKLISIETANLKFIIVKSLAKKKKYLPEFFIVFTQRTIFPNISNRMLVGI